MELPSRVSSSTAAAGQQQFRAQNILSLDEGDDAARQSPLNSEFEAFTKETLSRWHVPGIAVAVVDGDDTWAQGYGIANFPSSPVTPSTLFYMGSTTKAFTAATAALLIADGKYSSPQDGSPLGWQTPISHLIRDDFVLQRGYEWEEAHLTLEDALSHRTGFPRHDKALARHMGPSAGAGTVADADRTAAVREVVRSLRYLPMVAEPRTTFRYCNVMFMVVSHAIQSLTGRWLGATMRERIWAPLGMDATFLSVEEARATPGVEVAHGYYWDYLGAGAGRKFETGDGGEGGFVEVPFSSLEVASGAGGVVSNVLDYARWIRCLVREDGADAVLPAEAHRELTAARTPLSPESGAAFDAPLAYALGWRVGTYRGHRVFMHGGGMEAHGAELFFFPDLNYGVVALANTAVTSNFAGKDLAWKLINNRLGVPEAERFDWAESSKQKLDDILGLADTAVETLYPVRANPPLPRALPLEAYAGTYSHPAYRTVKIELAGDDNSSKAGKKRKSRGELKAVRDNMEWQMVFEFVHVSGEHWAVVIDFLNTPNMLNGQLARAEFVVGVGGAADALRMEFLEDGSEGVIVFDRV
ncbi:beta-lactamase/transpeptidase-like protein [Hypoxylon sp. FL1284]|nr:beta-lactamase/transpeptidase-like protein [Hypoxylon sp. FL1284]